MNIAIVDDQASDCEALGNLLKQYETEQHHPLQLKIYHSGKELLENYIPGRFDAIFLDIFLNQENGVDCALRLRQLDQKVNLIFLTTSPEFGVKSYDVRAADYIVKPATPEKLIRALRYCGVARPQSEPLITLPTRHQPLEIALDRILYADYENRAACVHLEDCLVPVPGSFSELAKQLTAHPRFMVCFKGIVVNLTQVREVCGDRLILKNGEQLPVSRRMQRQVQQRRLSLFANSLREGT